MNPAWLSMSPDAHLGLQHETRYVALAASEWFRWNLTQCQRQESQKWLPDELAEKFKIASACSCTCPRGEVCLDKIL